MSDDEASIGDWGTDTVNIYVGRKRKQYVFHKSRICEVSPYFNRMFNGNFIEGQSQECYLAEDDPEGFQQFMEYAYSGSIPTNHTLSRACELKVKFYIAADKYLLPNTVKVEIINSILAKIDSTALAYLSSAAVNLVLRQTAVDCPLRQLFVDLVCKTYMRGQSVKYDTTDQTPGEKAKVGEEKCKPGTEKQRDRWLAECLDEVEPSQIARLFRVLKDGRDCWNDSSSVGGELISVLRRGVLGAERYQTGFLSKKLANQTQNPSMRKAAKPGSLPSWYAEDEDDEAEASTS